MENKTVEKEAEVPYVEGLRNMDDAGLLSAVEERCAANPIAELNWPEAFPYCPEATFRVAHDGKCLAVVYHVKGRDLRAVGLEDNSKVWQDSCCECFLKTSDGEYMNFEMNCIGSLLVEKGAGRGDRCFLPDDAVRSIRRYHSLEHKTYDIAGGCFEWTLALLIPFELLGYDPAHLPQTIGANFYKCGDLTATPHYLSWNPVRTAVPDFHRPEFFGVLKLEPVNN